MGRKVFAPKIEVKDFGGRNPDTNKEVLLVRTKRLLSQDQRRILKEATEATAHLLFGPGIGTCQWGPVVSTTLYVEVDILVGRKMRKKFARGIRKRFRREQELRIGFAVAGDISARHAKN